VRRWTTRSEAETLALGRELGRELAPDGVLLLSGDLGAGKTVLARGIGEALGVGAREVQSPTYTLIREHQGSGGRLVHVDLYRLEPAETAALGLEELLAGPGVKVIEWAERLPFALPGARVLRLARTADGEGREIEEVDTTETNPEIPDRRDRMKKIKKVGVLGCGLMGSGVAEVAARSGYETVVREVSSELMEKGVDKIRGSLNKAVERGKLEAGARDEAVGRLSGTVDLAALADCDIVIEAIVENLEDKRKTFTALDEVVKKDALFASNTSSLTITQMAMFTQRPDQFVGLHFFNPVPVMKLVEVVRTLLTSDESFDRAFEFARSLGKEPVAARDNSGFIVNRLLVPYLLDAIRALEEGVGSVEDIDKGMQLGCGYPMGPFTLLDFVGLDTTYYIAGIMFDEYKEKRFASPPLLKQMVTAGRLGKKSGRGFYDYSKK